MKIKKEKSLEWHKKALQKDFNLWIRLSYSDPYGCCQCVTCGSRHHYKKMDAGHFISVSVDSTRYDETNVHPQCVRCNKYLHGNHHLYREYLLNRYGKEEIEALEKRAKNLKFWKVPELIKKRKEYKRRIANL